MQPRILTSGLLIGSVCKKCVSNSMISSAVWKKNMHEWSSFSGQNRIPRVHRRAQFTSVSFPKCTLKHRITLKKLKRRNVVLKRKKHGKSTQNRVHLKVQLPCISINPERVIYPIYTESPVSNMALEHGDISADLLVKNLPKQFTDDDKESLLQYFGAKHVVCMGARGKMVRNWPYIYQVVFVCRNYEI